MISYVISKTILGSEASDGLIIATSTTTKTLQMVVLWCCAPGPFLPQPISTLDP